MRQRGCLRAAHDLIGGSAAAAALAVMLLGATTALAAGPGAWWRVESHTVPTNLPPGGEGELRVTATNPGDAPITGVTKIIDTLPPGLQATGVEGFKHTPDRFLTCEPTSGFPAEGGTITCTFPGPEGPPELPPFEVLEVVIKVKVAGASAGPNQVTVKGGQAEGHEVEAKSISSPIEVSSTPTPFGIHTFELE